MTQEFEWSIYDKRDLLLNEKQLLTIGDRNFPVRERRLEFQHPHVAFFNVGFDYQPPRHPYPCRYHNHAPKIRRRPSWVDRSES
jgi:hypothetical protein